MLRGSGSYLFDDRGRRFVDGVSNVCHVGHGHPSVVAAAARQMATLNTNTRYLHPVILDYAQRLVSLLRERFWVCYLVNSGSEANELAIRLARAHTGRHGVAVLDQAYHGNTSTLVAISPYKFSGPGGTGAPDWVTVLPLPDPYRSPFGGTTGAAAYGAVVGPLLGGAEPAAFISESVAGVAGQIVFAEGTLAVAYNAAKAAGSVVIADEVQIGFGRVGDTFWGFELAGATPDIVTMGKPMGNGHPLGAVVTTADIAHSFANGMEYFNTYGGNPVSSAVGLAVLDVIEEERLQSQAAEVGGSLMTQLAAIGAHDARIGQVRGAGLFVGIEFVRPDGSKTPDAVLAGGTSAEAGVPNVVRLAA